MSKENRYLITTSDERTWKFDCPVIFLGEWCRLFSRSHIWQDMDAIIAAPYGLGQSKKDSDQAEARLLKDKLFRMLCEALNQYHGVQHLEPFWRIVLEHWLHRYVKAMLNRVKTLEQCLQAHQLTGTIAYANDRYALATQDSYSAIWAFNDSRWNNALTVRILDLLGEASIPVEFIEGCSSSGFRFEASATTSSFKRKFLRWGYQQVGKLASCLVRDNDAFIINSYLPKKEEIKLQLALGQCPQLRVSPKLEISKKPDRALRESLASRVESKSGNKLDNILGVMVFELLPVCYLEGFAHLNKLVNKQHWPKSPKFIFTSNNFDTDEVFKLWTAKKVESGITYITGQHGNNYGTNRYMFHLTEESTSYKFLTWGWTDGLPQHTPAFIFKTAGQKAKHYNPQGGLLLIEVCLNHRISTWDDHFEYVNYFKDQEKMIRTLARHPKEFLTIRLGAEYRQHKWCEESRWQAFDPSLRIEKGVVKIQDLIAESRLVIHSYDSTGILETLSQNIPTLAFWQNGLDHLRENAKSHYQLLVDVGIVHLTPKSVAQKVNEVWDDIDGWWGQNKVQDARKQFCLRYAKVSRNPVRELKQILSQQVMSHSKKKHDFSQNTRPDIR